MVLVRLINTHRVLVSQSTSEEKQMNKVGKVPVVARYLLMPGLILY